MRSGSLALALALLCGGCVLGDESSDEGQPCEDAGCADDDETSGVMEDPSCMLEDELEVELGQGETEFSPLAPGELPELFWGIQGGQHVWMAIRVKNPECTFAQYAMSASSSRCAISAP